MACNGSAVDFPCVGALEPNIAFGGQSLEIQREVWILYPRIVPICSMYVCIHVCMYDHSYESIYDFIYDYICDCHLHSEIIYIHYRNYGNLQHFFSLNIYIYLHARISEILVNIMINSGASNSSELDFRIPNFHTNPYHPISNWIQLRDWDAYPSGTIQRW